MDLQAAWGRDQPPACRGSGGVGRQGLFIILQCLSFPTCEMQQMSQCKDQEKPAAYRLERFEQPLVPDSPLWPYPERGAWVQTDLLSTRGAGGCGRARGREGAGQCPAMLLGLFPGCCCRVGGRNLPLSGGGKVFVLDVCGRCSL